MEALKNEKILAYTILRLTMGVNIFLHGAVRLPKLAEFEAWMQGLYKESLLASFVVQIFGYGIPILEALVGVFLILGLWTQKTYLAGATLMLALITGSCLIEKWDWAGMQMIYALFYFCLTLFIQFNKISVDEWKKPSALKSK